MSNYKDFVGKAEAARTKAQELLTQAGLTVEGSVNFDDAKQHEFDTLNNEALRFEVAAHNELAKDDLSRPRNYGGGEIVNGLPSEGAKTGGERFQGKSFNEVLSASEQWKQNIADGGEKTNFSHMAAGSQKVINIGTDPQNMIDIAGWVKGDQMSRFTGKTLSTSSGIAVPYAPQPGFTFLPQELPTLLDYMTLKNSLLQVYSFNRQTVNTDSAAVTAEGGTKPVGGMVSAYVNRQYAAITEMMTVTRQQLMFNPDAMNIIDKQGRIHIIQATVNQVLNGVGTGSQDTSLNGILNDTGKLTASSSGTNGLSAVMAAKLAKAKINSYNFAQANVANANVYVANPNDLYFMETVLNKLGDPIWPNRAMLEAYIGMSICETAFIAQGTSLAGDFREDAIELAYYQTNGVTVIVGYLANDFSKNQQTVLFETFATLATKKPWAFCAVTNGLPVIS